MGNLYNDERLYGELGNYTGFKDYYIGDILEAEDKISHNIANVVVVYDYKQERYSALGLLYLDISEFENDYRITKVISWKEVNNDNINKLTFMNGYCIK